MNIKLIKSEIEKLSLMLSAWEQSEQVSAIERDIVLDKLKKIYDAVRFDTAIEEDTPIEPTEPIAPMPAVEENDEESDEKEVEVELIFADDEFPEEDLVDENEIEEVEQPSATDIIAATVANALAYIYKQRNEPLVFRPIGRLDRNRHRQKERNRWYGS